MKRDRESEERQRECRETGRVRRGETERVQRDRESEERM